VSGARKRVLFEEEQGKTDDGWTRYLTGEVYWNAGGMNYFTNQHEVRGYYVDVTPEDVNPEGTMRRITGFAGIKAVLLEAPRFNRKTLDTIQVPADLIERLRARVAEKEATRRDRRVVA